MANWNDLKASVAEAIKTNGNQEITGQILQNTLNSIISNLGENATFAGIATPNTNPGTPDGNVFYLATKPGIYSNFNSFTVENNVAIIYNNVLNSGVWEISYLDIITGGDKFAYTLPLSSLPVIDGFAIAQATNKWAIGQGAAVLFYPLSGTGTISHKGGTAPLIYLVSNNNQPVNGENIPISDGGIVPAAGASYTEASKYLLILVKAIGGGNRLPDALYINDYDITKGVKTALEAQLTEAKTALEAQLTEAKTALEAQITETSEALKAQQDATATLLPLSSLPVINGFAIASATKKWAAGQGAAVLFYPLSGSGTVKYSGGTSPLMYLVSNNDQPVSGEYIPVSDGGIVSAAGSSYTEASKYLLILVKAIGGGSRLPDALYVNGYDITKGVKEALEAQITETKEALETTQESVSTLLPLSSLPVIDGFVIVSATKKWMAGQKGAVLFYPLSGEGTVKYSGGTSPLMYLVSNNNQPVSGADIPVSDGGIVSAAGSSYTEASKYLLILVKALDGGSRLPDALYVNGYDITKGIKESIESILEASSTLPVISPNFEMYSLPYNIGWWSDFIIIDILGELEIWFFIASSDEANINNDGDIVRVKMSDFTIIKKISHNLGHCNTVQYDKGSDTLIIGNLPGHYSVYSIMPEPTSNYASYTIKYTGETTEQYTKNHYYVLGGISGAYYWEDITEDFDDSYKDSAYIFYNISEWASKDSIDFATEKKTIIEFSNLGLANISCCFVENNINGRNIISVQAGNEKFIKVLLGKGTNQLSYGTYKYIDETSFNGTYEILNQIQNLGRLFESVNKNVIQGIDYINDGIITANGHDEILGVITGINSKNEFSRKAIINVITYNLDSTIDECYSEGICFYEGYIYQGVLRVGSKYSTDERYKLIKYKV